ncbi:MAG: cadmium-translocating P-type ATPase [Silicimonas sp.]|nr:cadmium-translocating P-type ATPase [Silicimonas sp.]
MSVAVCPACVAAPDAEQQYDPGSIPTHHLVLPTIHCAACIRTVENTLASLPDIRSARVNLTQKRVAISATAGADPSPWIDALAKVGFEAHEIDDQGPPAGDDYILHLGVAGFAMMNVMLLSVAVWSGAEGVTREFLHWISAAIALPAAAFCAQPFFRSAWPALKARRLNMDVPISLAIILACGMSLYEVVQGGQHAWFDAALSLTFFLLAGRVLDQRLRRAARSAADNLSALEPSRVTCVEDGVRRSRPIAEVRQGDALWIAAGGRVPVDCTLCKSTAAVDRSAITGESDPITCAAGQPLYAGDILLNGPHTLSATRVGEDTTLRRIAQLVATAEAARGKFRSLADQAAAVYTPAVHIISAAAFLGWLIATGDIRMSLNVAIATLIITCPCALGLAVPAVSVAATSLLYRSGLLVKSDTALERLAKVDTVVFDKTGTLTERRLKVPADMTEAHRQVLRAIAEASQHPLCRGLAKTMTDVTPAHLEAISESTGEGVRALWGDTEVQLGRGSLAKATVFQVGDVTYEMASEEQMLPGAEASVAELKARGMDVWMVTGDSGENADRIAGLLDIKEVRANLRPEEKIDLVKSLQSNGATVLMVGDGLNDTAALAAADASIAPSSALDASRNAADINIVSGDLTKIATALRISRAARSRMLENFAAAGIYNAIAVPIAVAGFATPLAAAIAMSASSITVVLNSQRGMRA